MSLKGKVIVNTQAENQAKKINSILRKNGADVYNLPMIKTQTRKIDDYLLSVLKKINSFDFTFFTSKKGVISFFEILNQSQTKLDSNIKFASIGAATTKMLNKHGFNVTIENSGNTSEDFYEQLKSNPIIKNKKILMALGNKAPDTFTNNLSKHADVTRINVYKTIDNNDFDNKIVNLITQNDYDLILFTSPSAFYNFKKTITFDTNKLKAASIGAITTRAIENSGSKVLITATKSNLEQLAQDIMLWFNNFKIS